MTHFKNAGFGVAICLSVVMYGLAILLNPPFLDALLRLSLLLFVFIVGFVSTWGYFLSRRKGHSVFLVICGFYFYFAFILLLAYRNILDQSLYSKLIVFGLTLAAIGVFHFVPDLVRLNKEEGY
jgi:hypothetical protein